MVVHEKLYLELYINNKKQLSRNINAQLQFTIMEIQGRFEFFRFHIAIVGCVFL